MLAPRATKRWTGDRALELLAHAIAFQTNAVRKTTGGRKVLRGDDYYLRPSKGTGLQEIWPVWITIRNLQRQFADCKNCPILIHRAQRASG